MTVPILTTRRLTLRPVAASDAPAIVRAMSNWEVVQWLSAPPFPYSLADAACFISDIVPQTTTWAIDAGEGLIGVIGVKPDLGYWLDTEFHGQHVMSEASAAVTDWYFSQTADDLISGHFAGNAASRNVLEKLGFVDTQLTRVTQESTQSEVSVQRMVLTHARWTDRHA